MSALLRDLRTVPNLLSLSRLVLIGACAALYLEGHPILGLALGLVAGITDYLDGWIARRTNQVTPLGAILDRLGDNVVEMVCFVLTIQLGVFPPILFILYLVREFVVSSVRLYCAEQRWPMPSSFFGKLKSNFLGYAFIIVLARVAGVVPGATVNRVMEIVSWGGVVAGLLFGYISGWQYVRAFVQAYQHAGRTP